MSWQGKMTGVLCGMVALAGWSMDASAQQSAFDVLAGGKGTSSAPVRRGAPTARAGAPSSEPLRLLPEDAYTISPWLARSKGSESIAVGSAPYHGHVVVGEDLSARRKGSAYKVSLYLVDLETGERTASIASILGDPICGASHMVFSLSEGGLMAYDFEAKRWLRTEVRAPEGMEAPFMTSMVAIEREGEAPSEFLVHMSSANLRSVHGVWRPADGASEVRLRELPFDGVRQARYHDGVIELNAFVIERSMQRDMFSDGPAHERTSFRDKLFRVSDRVEEVVSLSHDRGMSFIDGGYVAINDLGQSRILSADGEVRPMVPQGCKESDVTLYGVGHEPAAALYGCRMSARADGNEASYRFRYWSEEGGVREWTRTFDGMLTLGGFFSDTESERERPILLISMSHMLPDYSSWTSHLWVDMRTGEMGEGGEARHVIGVAPDRVTDQWLATDYDYVWNEHDAKRRIPLYLVDRGESRLVHVYDDCPGALQANTHHGGSLYELRCVTGGEKGKYVFFQQWSELVDVSRGTRWRLPKGQSISEVQEGLVVADSIEKGGNLLYGKRKQLYRVSEAPVTARR